MGVEKSGERIRMTGEGYWLRGGLEAFKVGGVPLMWAILLSIARSAAVPGM